MSEARILVIDDNKESCQIIKDTLEANGYSVDTAFDGEIGLNKVRFTVKQQKSYFLCITDVMLPKVSGIDLLKRAREIDPSMGVIVISAFDEVDPFIKKEALSHGAYAFIAKPIEPAKLLATVREYFSSRKIRKTSEGEGGTIPFFGTVARKTTTVNRDEVMEAIDGNPDDDVHGSGDTEALEMAEPAPPADAAFMPTMGMAPPPPPLPDELDHITKPVPDAGHFQDFTAAELNQPGDLPFVVTRCPMCAHLIKIAKDVISAKIWCSNCGILFDKVDVDVNEEMGGGSPASRSGAQIKTPFPAPSTRAETETLDVPPPPGMSRDGTATAYSEGLTATHSQQPGPAGDPYGAVPLPETAGDSPSFTIRRPIGSFGADGEEESGIELRSGRRKITPEEEAAAEQARQDAAYQQPVPDYAQPEQYPDQAGYAQPAPGYAPEAQWTEQPSSDNSYAEGYPAGTDAYGYAEPVTGQEYYQEPAAEAYPDAQGYEQNAYQENAQPQYQEPLPLRILVVEDDLHAGEILRTALDVAGFQSDIVDAGDIAFNAIVQSLQTADPYSLVISDVMIPGMNGLDLMRKVREYDGRVQFILVSAYEDQSLSLQRQAESEGALRFFSKPYDYKELIRYISQLQG